LTMEDNIPSWYTKGKYGLLVDYRYFAEIEHSANADLGVLMLHQGSEYDSEQETITLQPKRARMTRVDRMTLQGGAYKAQKRVAHLKVGRLVKFGQEPHRFDLANLRPVGNPLQSPLPVIDASQYAKAKADWGLERRKLEMERFEAKLAGQKPAEEIETTVVADVATPLGEGLWACRQGDGSWLLIDEEARFEPQYFASREEMDAQLPELRAN